MKYLLMVFAILLALFLRTTQATVIYTPGVGGQVITDTPNGFMITDLAGGGNTTVETFGSTTVIQQPGLPPTFIRDDAGAPLIEPVVPIQEHLAVPVEGYL
jgi:hypothetical protein